jgi:hypothetical protein
VYVHPILNFLDNVAYLVFCTLPERQSLAPIVAVLVDCGELDRILRHMGRIYERYYSCDYPCGGSPTHDRCQLSAAGAGA